MSVCNDPKCPLIRQGTRHEAHDKIGDQDIVEQCNDPRCAVNRTGIRHNRHDEYFRTESRNGKKAGPQESSQKNHSQDRKPRQDHSGREQETRQEPEDDIMDRIFREVLDELGRQSRQRHARQSARQQQQQQQSANEPATNASKASQRARPGASQVPAGNTILAATSPHDIFGIPKEAATCRMIKSRYRDLARAYDPSKGIINKSDIDKKISNEIMTRINSAYLQLKEIYGCRK